jgi:MFS family permease
MTRHATGFRDGAAYAWVVVFALWPVAMLNYLDRQMIATIRASMRADIPSIANDQDFGTLMAVFLAVYAILSPLGGLVADRFNRRWTVVGSLFVWSVVTWLTGHMQTYHQMLFCRGLMGISEACYIPAALALIADYHPGNTRARAVGLSCAWSMDAAIVCLVLFGLGWGFYDCANMPILCQIVPPELRATGYGLMNLMSIGVGAVVTVLLGWMRDQGISFALAFIFCGGMALVSAGLIRLIRLRETSLIPCLQSAQREDP